MKKIQPSMSDDQIMGNMNPNMGKIPGQSTIKIEKSNTQDTILKHEPTYVTSNKRRHDWGQVDYTKTVK